MATYFSICLVDGWRTRKACTCTNSNLTNSQSWTLSFTSLLFPCYTVFAREVAWYIQYQAISSFALDCLGTCHVSVNSMAQFSVTTIETRGRSMSRWGPWIVSVISLNILLSFLLRCFKWRRASRFRELMQCCVARFVVQEWGWQRHNILYAK